MNTSIGKRLALLLSGVLLLTGCYAAPAAESVRQGSTPPESAQPTQPPAAETAITTYPVPEENLLVSINMARFAVDRRVLAVGYDAPSLY